MSKAKLLLFLSIVVLFFFFFYFDLNQYLTLDFFLGKKQEFDKLYQSSPILFLCAFFLIYVLCAALNIPGATILTLVSGFLFSFIVGSVVVSLGSTVGATLSFFISRFLLRDFIQKKFQSRLKKINQGLEKDGIFYIFSLRLIPVFPFFIVNLLMGLTPVSAKGFFIASFFGMLPSTFVYVNAGSQLSNIKSLSELISPTLIISFLFLAFLPWIMKFFLKAIRFKVHSQ